MEAFREREGRAWLNRWWCHLAFSKRGTVSRSESTAPDCLKVSGTLPMPKPIFRVRDLTKIYGNGTAEVRALDGVDLELYEIGRAHV